VNKLPKFGMVLQNALAEPSPHEVLIDQGDAAGVSSVFSAEEVEILAFAFDFSEVVVGGVEEVGVALEVALDGRGGGFDWAQVEEGHGTIVVLIVVGSG